MAKLKDQNINQDALSKAAYSLFDFTKKEKSFLLVLCILVSIAGFITQYTYAAMWFGFSLAAYSAIGNDSIQTIGTFIASNQKKKWYWLWFFMGGIFVVTAIYSWVTYGGDVSYQRLHVKGLDKAPQEFVFLQLAAPIVLMVMTRLRMPVSTTFLLLNVFTYKAGTIAGVVQKSLIGYLLAFVIAISVWYVLEKFVTGYLKGQIKSYWYILQWVTSGTLWALWLMQDAANIAVFLPRELNIYEFIAYAGFIFFGMGFLFYFKGDRIQGIVNEKTQVTDVRAATIVDFVYCILLFYFKMYSKMPMSTTWVFIGLLGGREIAIAMAKSKKLKKRKARLFRALMMARNDVVKAFIGLVVSLVLALVINEGVREEVMNLIFK
ncbi:hypothetical protein GCM10007049_30270 [Echinicola pacifica]|uniref:Phosphate/sulfate permease n=1 Tax=Echinicola pacifica TaxID=346377 RepID=A0A918Q5I0_9BACT|nr:hypothetical protein [Echinicola pacifica]GGZ34810.1 hypothetical protein GCM10007049_30270 [Echinicola pacifica]